MCVWVDGHAVLPTCLQYFRGNKQPAILVMTWESPGAVPLGVLPARGGNRPGYVGWESARTRGRASLLFCPLIPDIMSLHTCNYLYHFTDPKTAFVRWHVSRHVKLCRLLPLRLGATLVSMCKSQKHQCMLQKSSSYTAGHPSSY